MACSALVPFTGENIENLGRADPDTKDTFDDNDFSWYCECIGCPGCSWWTGQKVSVPCRQNRSSSWKTTGMWIVECVPEAGSKFRSLCSDKGCQSHWGNWRSSGQQPDWYPMPPPGTNLPTNKRQKGGNKGQSNDGGSAGGNQQVPAPPPPPPGTRYPQQVTQQTLEQIIQRLGAIEAKLDVIEDLLVNRID